MSDDRPVSLAAAIGEITRANECGDINDGPFVELENALRALPTFAPATPAAPKSVDEMADAIGTTVTNYFVRRITSRSRNRYAACLCGLRGKDFLTSGPIVSIDGRKVTTRSGSVYTLDGPPRWPGENYDDDNPLASDGVSFYLDTPSADVWPVGATVPEVSDE